MAYQTDENGNLYDENGNFLAKSWEYNVDENWNVQIFPQGIKNQASQEQVNPIWVSGNENVNQETEISNFTQGGVWHEISTVQTETKTIFQKIDDFFTSLISWKHVNELALSESLWLAVKWDKSGISYEDKFPSELSVSEDMRRFLYNVSHVWQYFFSESSDKKNAPRWKLFFIWKAEIVEFLDQLSTLIYAWIRLIDAIRIIKKQSGGYSQKVLYASIEEKLNNWKHLSESLWDYDYIFPTKWVKLILAAEKSGQLDKILRDLAEEEKMQMQFVAKVKWAMIYPSILLIMTVWVFVLMMTQVVPTLEKSFWWTDSFPPLTINIINMSHYMTENYYAIMFYPIAFFILMGVLNSQFITVQKMIDFVMLRFPIFGQISRRKNIIIFTENFSLLLKSWVLVSESLRIVAQILPSVLFRAEVHRIRHWVENWVVISKMMWLSDLETWNLKDNFYFPLEIAQMIKIWEETGNTAEILNKILEINNSKLNNTVKNLTAMMEPIITVVIWLWIWTLLMAFIVPMLNSFKSV